MLQAYSLYKMDVLNNYIISIKIKKENDLNAPVNDIVRCIEDLQSTGIPEEQIIKMVPNMFKSSNSNSYVNKQRNPHPDEILIYDVSSNWVELFKNPT